jgi:D-alanyl-D-alanine carboxypeptidase
LRLSILVILAALLAIVTTADSAAIPEKLSPGLDRGPRTTDRGPLTTQDRRPQTTDDGPPATDQSPVTGTWEGKMDGLPVLSITVKDEGGALSGTVTFYRIRDEGAGPKVDGKETTPLVGPKLDGKVLSFQAKGRSGEMVGFKMELTVKNEARIILKRMINGESGDVPVQMTREQTTIPPAETTAQDRLSESAALSSIDELIRSLAGKDEFSGAVLVAKDGSPILQRADGLASREYNVPNRIDTKFNLGSINKIFTQILIGQLIDQGKLLLDDHLVKLLPDYPNHEAAEKVTLRQLLDMTSGIGDFFGLEFEATPKDRIRNLKDYLPLFANKPLEFEPGTKNKYSNGGYVALGLIIEKLTGKSYYEYARERIFTPTGMENTGYFEADVPESNLASGYTRHNGGPSEGGPLRNNFYSRPARGSSAGGGYSTAQDMLKFANALHERKLVIPNFAARTGSAPPRDRDGLGIAGGAPGINSTLDTGVAGHYTVIVMSNYDPPSAMNLAKQIRQRLAQITSP